MLKQRVHHVCENIKISKENIAVWPDEGDIMDRNIGLGRMSLEQVDEGEIMVTGEHDNRANDGGIHLDQDGIDASPAPLLNSEIPEENFDVIMNIGETNISHARQIDLLHQAVADVVTRING